MSGTKAGALKAVAIRKARGEIGGLGLAEMRARSKPGECICCGDPARAKSTKPLSVARRVRAGSFFDTCGEPECRVAWFRFWRRDQRRIVAAMEQSARALRGVA